MIFLSNAEGVITAAIPEPINQGSVGVNRIVLIAPFPSNAVVSATFTQPNGIKIYPRYVGETYNRPYLMGVVEAFINKGLEIDGVTMNAWQLTLDKAITSVAGNVTVQFLVTTAAGTTAVTDENGEEKTIGVIIPGTEQTLTTTSATLPINRGNAYLAPSVSDKDLDTIAGYLAAAKTSEANAKESENAAKTAATNAQTAQDYAETSANEAGHAKEAAETAEANAETAQAAAEAAQSAASNSATAALNSATAAETAQEKAEAAEANAKVAQKKAEEAANRASPWDLVITPQNLSDVLANWTQIEAASMLFFNIDFSQLVYGENPYIEFGNSTRKLEFRGCTFGDELGISLIYSGPQCSIKGAKGDELVIQGFTDVIDCRANIIKDCQYVTACDAVTLDDCQCVSDTTASTFTNCIFVDPFTVKGFVPVIDNGKVPTLSQSGGYVPKQLPAKIVLAVDDQYIVTATLKDVNNNDIDSATIDLPLESVVVGATVSEDGKTLILKLQNETTTEIPIENIFQGLATKDWVNAQISDVNTTINGIGTRVTALENGLETAETDISTLKEDMSAAETEIEELKRSKLDSAGLTHSYDGSANTSFGVGDGVVIHSRQSDGEIVIQGYETKPSGDISYFTSITARSIAGVPYDDIARKGKVEALETQNTILKKRVDNIEGVAIDFVIDSTDAVTKTVPTDALPYAKIMKIGGKTYVEDTPDGFILKSAPVSELVSEGENLTPFPYNEGDAGSVIEKYGVTFTVNSDGSITINGTSTEFATFALSSNIAFKAGETYARTPSESSISFVISYIEDGTTQYLSGLSFTWGGGWTFNSAYLQISPGTTVNNVTFRPMINKGSTLLPYRPYFKSTFLIPEAVRPANGINANACDYIAWEADGTRKKYKCIAIVDMGSLNWTLYNNEFTVRDLDKKNGGYNLLSPIYTNAGEYQPNVPDKSIMGYPTEGWITIKDTSYNSVASFKDALSGVMLAYELATPIVTGITDILTPDNYIEVEGGGTITAVNGGKGAPTTIYYATEKTGG